MGKGLEPPEWSEPTDSDNIKRDGWVLPIRQCCLHMARERAVRNFPRSDEVWRKTRGLVQLREHRSFLQNAVRVVSR